MFPLQKIPPQPLSTRTAYHSPCIPISLLLPSTLPTPPLLLLSPLIPPVIAISGTIALHGQHTLLTAIRNAIARDRRVLVRLGAKTHIDLSQSHRTIAYLEQHQKIQKRKKTFYKSVEQPIIVALKHEDGGLLSINLSRPGEDVNTLLQTAYAYLQNSYQFGTIL